MTKKLKGTKIIKKSLRFYFFSIMLLFSILSQIIHCIIFYYCRTLFMSILTTSKVNILTILEEYAFMCLLLVFYSQIIQKIHNFLLQKIVYKKKTLLIIEDVLLNWKYFFVLFYFLGTTVTYSYFGPIFPIFSIYLYFIIPLKEENKSPSIKNIFYVYTFVSVVHIYLVFYMNLKHLNSFFLLNYSIIYFAIYPCYGTITRIKQLFKIPS